MKFHYDVTGAEPIVRDVRIYSTSALTRGTVMAHGAVATAENQGAAIKASATTLSNVMGVLNEDVAAADALSVVAVGTDKYAKLIINPFAVWLARYSQLAADDVPITTAANDGKSVTITQVTDHERGWVYITDVGGTTGGYGNLFQVGAATSTTSLTAATGFDDNLLGNIVNDTCIVLHTPYSADVAGGSVNLATNCIDIRGHTASAGAGAAIVIENYIESKTRPMEPLVCSRHSGYNYKAEEPFFWADVVFSEHLLANATVSNRVIT